jgi:hypothetical protein
MREVKKFSNDHFYVELKKGYVLEEVRGIANIKEAEEAADFAINLAKLHDCRKLMVDVSHMEWINDISIRNRGTEIIGGVRKLFIKSAIVSPKTATRFLVVGLMRGGGLPNVKGFSTKFAAAKWLQEE